MRPVNRNSLTKMWSTAYIGVEGIAASKEEYSGQCILRVVFSYKQIGFVDKFIFILYRPWTVYIMPFI